MDFPEDLNHKDLWKEHIQRNCDETRNELVVAYWDLARMCASNVYERVPNSVSIDDLEHFAVNGLMDAIDRYDPQYGVTFLNYAPYRIRGQIIDGLRSDDWVPKKTRDDQKRIQSTIQELRSKLGRKPYNVEIADAEDISLEELRDIRKKTEEDHFQSIKRDSLGTVQDWLESSRGEPSPDEKSIKGDFLWKIVKQIPPKRRLIFMLIVKEDLHLREVDKIIDLNPPQISKLHNRTLDELAEKIDEEELRDLI